MLRHLKYAIAAGVLLAMAPLAMAETPADTLVMAKNIDDVITLDPAQVYELTGVEIVANIYDRIMRFEPSDINKIAPGVAESYTVSSDGKTLTFKIRSGLKFASGNPITAADAAYSLQRVIKLNKSPAFLISQLGWDKDNVDKMVKAVDDSTLQITITEDFSPSLVLSLMSSVVASVVDSKIVSQHIEADDFGNKWLTSNSAGSGSYSLKAWKPNETISLTANPNARGGAAKLARVIVRHVPEPAAQRLLIEKGDVDIARDLTTDQINGIAGNKDIVVTTIPQATLHYIGLNLKTPQFKDPKVVQALHYLVDYDGMANSFLKGGFSVHQSFWPSGFPGSLDTNMYTFDPAKAKALLAEAGFPNGFEISMDARNSAPHTNIAQAIQASMAQGGIKMTIIPAEEKAVLTKYRARQHQMLLIDWGPDYMDPHTNADSFARNPDNSDAPKSKPLAWRNAWDIPELTKKADAAVLERDAKKRKTMYEEMQADFRKDSPFVMLYQQIEVAAYRSNVKDLKIGPTSDSTYMFKVSK